MGDQTRSRDLEAIRERTEMFEKQKMNEFTPGKDVPIEPTWGVTYDGPKGLSSRGEKRKKQEEGAGKMVGLRFNESPKFSHRMTPKQYE